MAELHDICYIRLGCPDLEGMVEFSTKVLGLELYERGDDWAFVRADDKTHNICYHRGELSEEIVGFEVASASVLDEFEQVLKQANVTVSVGTDDDCERRKVDGFIAFKDPSGTCVEVCVGPQHTGRRYFPARDAGITEFGHFGIHACDHEASLAFWTQIMGARVSDSIGAASLLRIDPVHHKLALFPSDKVGIQHINFQVASIDDIMRAWYLFQEIGVPVVFGPGRHPTSTAKFLYFRGPDQRVYEYSSGVKKILDEDSYIPRRFDAKPSSFCMWGSKPQISEFVE